MAERENRRSRRDRDDAAEFGDRLVAINRVSKTVKGGKRFGFAALVVVGDQNGQVGFGKGKAKEVPEAIRKATEGAKRKLVRVPLREGRTLHHDIEGRHGAGKVVIRTAPEGTGIIAGGPMRAVFEMLGVKDVVAKSIGSQNPYNMIRATIQGLVQEQSPRLVAQRRGKKVADINASRFQQVTARRTDAADAARADAGIQIDDSDTNDSQLDISATDTQSDEASAEANGTDKGADIVVGSTAETSVEDSSDETVAKETVGDTKT